jgi:hypothetical protein
VATFYIFGERPVNGTGTFADPYNAPPTMTSGNEYLFAAGIEYRNVSATAVNVPAGISNVTVGCYDPNTGERLRSGSYKAKIRCNSQYSVRLNTNSHGATLEMLDITNDSNVANARGILIGNSTSLLVNDVTISQCDIHDVVGTGTSNGVQFYGNNLRVLNTNIWNIPDDGVFGYGNNLTVSNCRIWDINQSQNAVGDCIQLAGDATLGCSNPRIVNNYLENPKGSKQCLIVQDTSGASSGGLIAGNYMVCKQAGASNQPLYVEINGTLITRNKIFGGYYNAFVAGNSVVFNVNLCVGATNNGLHQSTLATGITARNNTVAKAGNTGINLGSDATAVAQNNLIVGCGVAVTRNVACTASHNWVWQNTSDGNPGPSSPTNDPRVNGDFMPIPGSPLLTSGADLGYRRDIRGNKARKFIGAYAAAQLRRVY